MVISFFVVIYMFDVVGMKWMKYYLTIYFLMMYIITKFLVNL